MIFVHRGTFVLLRDFNGMTGREDMFTRCVGRIGVLAGFCSTALLIGLATSAYRTSLSREPQEFFSATIERTLKGDRLTHSTNIAGPSNSIAVDLFGTSDVVVRDPDGNIMFAVNHSARTTTVGKQQVRVGRHPKPITQPAIILGRSATSPRSPVVGAEPLVLRQRPSSFFSLMTVKEGCSAPGGGPTVRIWWCTLEG
jgi:hypothetical protein